MELLTGHDLHRNVIQKAVLFADKYVWIATANLKDMHIPVALGYKPILEIFNNMAARGVSFRIVHSDLPSRPFRATLERFPRLTSGALELQICPRCHWKMVIVDGEQVMAEIGEGNLNWPDILQACRDAEVEWYAIEQDVCRRDPFESLKISYENLRAMDVE